MTFRTGVAPATQPTGWGLNPSGHIATDGNGNSIVYEGTGLPCSNA
nr:DUF1522 domain-containing protein [Bradyrhizobium sp.]